MANQFFKNFPQIYYDLGDGAVAVTDITKRFVIQDIVRSVGTIYYTHRVQDGERPDIIADRFYKDSKLDWVVLMTNQILDPIWDWPLDYQSFKRFLISKYGSIPACHQTVHHYEKIVAERTVMTDGVIIPERVVIIDETAYDAIIEDFLRRKVSMYEYENQLNEARKTIRIIHESYIPQILREVENIFAN